MADEHTSAISFEENYEEKVSFYIGSSTFTDPDSPADDRDRSAPNSPEISSVVRQDNPLPQSAEGQEKVKKESSKIDLAASGGLSSKVVDNGSSVVISESAEQLPDKRLLQTRKLAKQLAVEIEEALEAKHLISANSESQFVRLGVPTTITCSQSDSSLAELAASNEHANADHMDMLTDHQLAELFRDAQERKNSRQSDGHTDGHRQKDKTEIMKIFTETEKSFREEFFLPDIELMSSMEEYLSAPPEAPLPKTFSPAVQGRAVTEDGLDSHEAKQLPKTQPTEVVKLPAPYKKSLGLDQLNKLAKLMEQLSFIREENTELRKRCYYLEDTKSLLQLQNEMLLVRTGAGRSIFKNVSPSKVMQYLSTPFPEKLRPRCPSDNSDAGSAEAKVSKLHQRSQSVGSIDIVDMEVNITPRSKSADKDTKETSAKPVISRRRRFENKKSRKFHKVHSKVKKLFSGKPESGHKSDSGAITAEQLVRVNSKHPHHDRGNYNFSSRNRTSSSSTTHMTAPPSPNSVKSEPTGCFLDRAEMDQLLHMDDDDRDSPSPQSPLSAFPKSTSSSSSVPSPHSRIMSKSQSAFSLASEEVQAFLSRKEDEHSLSDSERDRDIAKMRMIKPILVRRQSSPTLSIQSQDDTSRLIASTPKVVRSSSFRFNKTGSNQDSPWTLMDQNEPHSADSACMGAPFSLDDQKFSSGISRRTRSAWGRVKDIIHTRKDSLKRKNRLSHSGSYALDLEGELATDDSSHDYRHDRWTAYDKLQDKGCLSDGDKSPTVLRKADTALENSPPPLQRKGSQFPLDVSSLMGELTFPFNFLHLINMTNSLFKEK